jgi:hypothetical protein
MKASIDVALLHHLFVEVNDFDEILATVAQPPIAPALCAQISKALSGNPHRADDKNSTARDTQFELVVASTLSRSGYHVEFVEPDLRCHRDDESFVVAVKRIKAGGKLQTRLKAGWQQVVNSGLQGIVVVDVSCILNPKDAPFVAADAMRAQDFISSLLTDHVKSTTVGMRHALTPGYVFGLLFHAAIPVVIRPDTLTYERLWATANVLPPDHPKTHDLRRILRDVPRWR